MYVEAVGSYLLRENLVKGKKWYSLTADYAFGHDLLRVAQEVHGRQRRPVRGRRAGADRRHRLLALSPENPSGAARPRGVEPRGQPDHQLPQAICRIRPAVPGGRLRLRHRGRLGRRQGQFLRHLAAGLASPGRHAELEEIRRGVPEEIRQAARQPVVGRLQLAQDRRAVDERDQVGRSAEARRASAQGREVRRDEGARGVFPSLRQPDGHGNVRGARQGAGEDEGPVGHLRRARHRPRPERGHGSHRAAEGRHLQDR